MLHRLKPFKKHTWNHTTRKTQCKDCELTYMWEFTRGQNHIEKLSTTVTIVKQLGCTGKENVKTAGSHEMHTCDNCQRIMLHRL